MRVAVTALIVLMTSVAFAQPAPARKEFRPIGGELGPGVPAFGVRAGFRVTLAVDNVARAARFLEVGDDGTLYCSIPRGGVILSLKDKDNDGTYETRAEFVTGHPDVHGMHFKDGWLWYTQARTGEGHKSRDTNGDGVADETVTIFKPGSIPTEGGNGHSFRAILVAADRVYISVSDPSNMLDSLDTNRKKVFVYDLDGSNRREFASGIRNTEKLRFAPGTQDIWGCDHGSDNFGRPFGEGRGNQAITDMNPPEELNLFTEGAFYGHPYITGNRVPRPEFASRPDILELATRTTPPQYLFGAHWAPNGFTFLAKDYFPNMQGDMLVAFHGSWNSSVRVGYKVARVIFDNQSKRPIGCQTVVSTLSDNDAVLARPVDCVELPDGSVLFSCDETNRIYRISKAE